MEHQRVFKPPARSVTTSNLHPTGIPANVKLNVRTFKNLPYSLGARGARGRPVPSTPEPRDDHKEYVVLKVQTIRVLRIHYHHDGSGVAMLISVQQFVAQFTHLPQRFCSRPHGLKEADICRIFRPW
ncbi:hypothetical protein HPB48_016248 [Haemaphysalis longicornis]|uniref:Uncharacterized protein n=1 Tax=Haemaphysalis longicornis TaxID=44386 RepID=A0A9J6GHK4_HAELO|nr:hypothetical protein HPB48_016248 [Haemaphysalis longicornis]